MLFWILSFVLIVSAVWVITAKKPVYSVVALLLHFAALAITYFSLTAEFMAVIQLIVYSGAIVILFLFVIALLSSGVAPFASGPDKLPKAVIPAIIVVLAIFGFTLYAVGKTSFGPPVASIKTSAYGVVGTANIFGSVADFGRALFTVHLLPFEITAFILMVAVIGCIVLAGDETPYVPSRRRAALVEREMREAIVRAGEQ